MFYRILNPHNHLDRSHYLVKQIVVKRNHHLNQIRNKILLRNNGIVVMFVLFLFQFLENRKKYSYYKLYETIIDANFYLSIIILLFKIISCDDRKLRRTIQNSVQTRTYICLSSHKV